jgi:gliding motility-associated-like protein
MTKRILYSLLAVFCTFLFCFQSHKATASHAMGADLTYECLGGNTYRLRVSFYRDCIGISAPNNVFVNVRSNSCGQNLGITCQPLPGTGQEVTPLCSSAVSTCNGGIFTGIQEWVYEGVITLPMQCTDWVFSYNLCCRNAAINTITTPASNTFYIYATLNNTISPCNSSPAFSNKPVPFACVGQQYCFNHGAFDADGDSLVYSLITPYQNATTTVNYIPPFTPTNPLTSVPAISFNSQTGDICMTPQNLEVTVMAVLVQEYRNGVLIGSVERDIQITVLNCNNNLPSLTGINGSNDFNTTVCAGDQLCFYINSTDVDASQNVTMNWDTSITGATFSISGGSRPTGTFCWTPSVADISNNAYCFTVLVHDNACPMEGTQVFSYCITVTGINVNAGPDQSIACNGQATISAGATGGTGNYTYLWNNGVTTASQVTGPGTYVVTVSDGNCTTSDTVIISTAAQATALFNTSGTCQGAAVQFTDQSSVTTGNITSWNWLFGDGSSAAGQNPSHLYTNAGSYNVALIIQTNLGCSDTIVQPLTIDPAPSAAFVTSPACAGNIVAFQNNSILATAYSWNFGNGQYSSVQNPSVNFAAAGNYNVSLVAENSNGCTDTFIQSITINPLPVAAFITSTNVCQGSAITFSDGSTANSSAIIAWNWTFGNGQTSSLQNPVITYPASGNFNVTLSVTNSNGCTSAITQNIAINPLPVANAGPDKIICVGGSASLIASGGIAYSWNPGGQTTDVISVSPLNSTVYTVTVTDANGCSANATVNVTVNPLPVIVVTPDQSVCAGNAATLSASGAVSYIWSPSGSTTAAISVSPASSTTYAVTGTNTNGCSATNFVTVDINPVPVVSLSNVFICPGVNAVLNAGNAGSQYQWSTGQSSQSITVSTAGVYSVTVTNSFGCTSVASSQVSQSGTIVNNLQNVSFCSGSSALLDAGNAGSSYLWSTGSTSQSITVTAGGAYSVTITDNNGCSGILTTTVNVNPVPFAQFTPNDVCINEPMQFQNVSTIGFGSLVSWSWSFGDGNVSQQQNPSHYYPVAGTYNVLLVVTSSSGCVDSINKSFNVFPLPVANFNYLNGCQNIPIQFSNSSQVAVGNITAWNWNFGDGYTSIAQNPSHQFANPGVYPVTLSVETAGGCTDSIVKLVTISATPVAAFSATPVCRGTPVQFNSTSSVPGGVISSWNWDLGNGQTSAIQNPSITYNNAGNYYNVTLIVTSNNGCMDTVLQPVNIFSLPAADAGPVQSICSGASATLTATGGTLYQWSTGSNVSTATVSPLSSTMYYVTVTNSNGCQATDSVRVIIKPLPVANAGPDKTVCSGNPVTLTGSGASVITWMPGNFNTASIVVSPLINSNYFVTVTGSNGCIATDTVQVIVNPIPLANAGPDQVICQGTTATLTAAGGLSYYWSTVGSNSQSIYVNPVAATQYAVQVTDSNGCKAWDSVAVTLNSTPVANLNPAFLCSGSSAILNAGNAGSTYLWSPNGETTQTITIADSGFYDVIITSPNGCIGYASANVAMGGAGITTNPVNVDICFGTTATLNAGNPGASYSWSTGAVSQSITVNSAGSYSVTITDAGGCSASFTSNVIVNPNPLVVFTAASECLGNSIQLTNNSTISTGTITTWFWNFGDGNNSVNTLPQHLYSNCGTYTVTLTATSGAACSSSVSQSLTVYPKPQASFVSDAVCHGVPSAFTDHSSVSTGVVSTWNWSFGDGTTSTVQNPLHLYSNPGIYNVRLISGTATGCYDTIVKQVTVYTIPLAQFVVANACNGTVVNFSNQSSVTDGTIASNLWSFGDGTTSAIPSPSHLYSSSSSYNVTLQVVSDLGCSSSITNPVIIYANPVITVSANNVCEGSGTSFSSSAIVNGSAVSAIYWNFGDGGTSNQPGPLHLYNSSGTYQAYMVAVSNQGCSDTANLNVIIYPSPNASFTASDECIDDAVTFSNQSVITTGSITNHLWNFGDGFNSTLLSGTHLYQIPGNYEVVLVTTSDFGCVDTSALTINVYPIPVAQFTTSNVCIGLPSAFYNQSQVTGGGTINCSWNFGDGSSSSAENPVHSYASAGTYTVTMIATTANGCTDSVSNQITIYPAPAAAFTYQNACNGSPVVFIDQSSVNGSVSTWNWNFSDGTSSSSSNPYHIFPDDGLYTVTLEVTSMYGCTASVTDTVMIYPIPAPQITVNSNCIYDPASFNSITLPGDTSTYLYNWSFGDGISSTLENPVHTYTTAGLYNASLEMTNLNGCASVANISVEIAPAPEAGFQFSNSCALSTAQFNNLSVISSGSIVSYSWNFGDSTIVSTDENPSHIYNSAGSYTVTLIAVSDNGCTDTVSQQITIYPLPLPSFTNTNAIGCGPITVAFTGSSYPSNGNIISWNWDFGNGENSQLQNPVMTYQNGGTYSVSLTVTSDMGCTGAAINQNIINIYPAPVAAFYADPNEAGILNPLINFNNISIGAVSYSWTFGDGTSSNLAQPFHVYADTGTYPVMLIAINSFGCIDTVIQYIHIIPEVTLFVPNAFTPNNDGINDLFTVAGIGIEQLSLNIFNRWGENIYTTADVHKGWDGTIQKNNSKAQQDVYVYDVYATDVLGKSHHQTGRVTLVR